MAGILSPTDTYLQEALILNVAGVLTTDQFEQLCAVNRDVRLELTSTGELIAMLPTGSKTGIRNANLTYQLTAWALNDGSGFSFDSSSLFTLPNGSMYSPDASWIRRDRWDQLSEANQERFAPICPDFVVELRSRTDSLKRLQAKMREFIENGASLGWLIDPLERLVYVYSEGAEVQVLENPKQISAEPLLKGFALQMELIW
ncbi:MAG: hypothetical protein C5B55_05495 [Blastocatellia bacterium]|nr:MAG: hypothetical protein C5B55_05495 [Blastocatellia bacterium]